MTMEENKFKGQFTARLSAEMETKINAIHKELQASGQEISSGPAMLQKLIELAEKGRNTEESAGSTQLKPGEIIVLEEEYNEKTALLEKFSAVDVEALMDDVERLTLENEAADLKLQEAISEAGKMKNGEFFAYDDPRLELAYAILHKRTGAGKNDGTLLALVNSVFKFLMIPQFNKQINEAEKFSYREYLINIPEDFKKQHNLK